jgi:hypothetical protein
VWRKKQKNRGLLNNEFARCPRVVFNYDREKAVNALLERHRKKVKMETREQILILVRKQLSSISIFARGHYYRMGLGESEPEEERPQFKFRRRVLPKITAKKPPLIPQIILPEDDEDKKLYQGLFKKKKLPIQFKVFPRAGGKLFDL